MELKNIKLYRITHIENIPHIIINGITHRNSINKNPNFLNIGDTALIDYRNTKEIIINNGINNEFNKIILGDFIPFYFGIKMPMLYVIQSGGNFVEKPIAKEEIIYLVISLEEIMKSTDNFYFSDGHATDTSTVFYDKKFVNKLPQIIDWDAVKSNYWGNQENLILKRKKQAEFLSSNDINPNFIVGYGCYNNSAKEKLISFGINETTIKVIPNAYF